MTDLPLPIDPRLLRGSASTARASAASNRAAGGLGLVGGSRRPRSWASPPDRSEPACTVPWPRCAHMSPPPRGGFTMNDQVDLSDLEPGRTATQQPGRARCLRRELELHQPFTVAGTAAEDAKSAVAAGGGFRWGPGLVTQLGTPPPGWRDLPAGQDRRVGPGRTDGPRRAPVVWLSGAAVAVVVALVLTVMLAPGGSSVAWSAVPTAPTAGDREAAAAVCGAPPRPGIGELESSGGASVDGAPAPAPAPEPGEISEAGVAAPAGGPGHPWGWRAGCLPEPDVAGRLPAHPRSGHLGGSGHHSRTRPRAQARPAPSSGAERQVGPVAIPWPTWAAVSRRVPPRSRSISTTERLCGPASWSTRSRRGSQEAAVTCRAVS